MDTVARSVGRRKKAGGHRSFLDRVVGRAAPIEDDPIVADLRDPGEDVWKSLRF